MASTASLRAFRAQSCAQGMPRRSLIVRAATLGGTGKVAAGKPVAVQIKDAGAHSQQGTVRYSVAANVPMPPTAASAAACRLPLTPGARTRGLPPFLPPQEAERGPLSAGGGRGRGGCGRA